MKLLAIDYCWMCTNRSSDGEVRLLTIDVRGPEQSNDTIDISSSHIYGAGQGPAQPKNIFIEGI